MNEPLDRNKSYLTHRATATVAAWLDGLGCKPVETEVNVGGWILDVASFWCPTLSEARRSRLLRDFPCPPDVQKQSHEHFERMSRRVGGRLTVAVEVKVSRSDFMADLGRKYAKLGEQPKLRRPSHLLVVAAPKSVLRDDLISCSRLILSECCTRVVKHCGDWDIAALHPGEIEDFIAEVAIRRDHSTRYASLRRWLKHYRARKA